MKAQALLAEGLLALAFSIIVTQTLFLPSQQDTPAELAVARAGHDVVKALYRDDAFMGNLTENLAAENRLNSSTQAMLHRKLLYYGKLLELHSLSFEIPSAANEKVILRANTFHASERFCFPITAKNATQIWLGCLTVSK